MPPSPEFVMPPEPPRAARELEEPASAPDASAARDRSALVAEEPFERVARQRLPWRQLAIAALVGVIVGAGIPSAFEAADRAATDARHERLRAVAAAYLDAIAAGESDRATAMVPVVGELPAEAVLRSAEPIAEPEVRLIAIDGDAATVEVSFEVARQRITRPLDADEVDGEWRLRTSLAEPVISHTYEGMPSVVVAGVTLPTSGRILLYPGRYEADRVTTPITVSGGQQFDVDGDPATYTELAPTIDLVPGMSSVVRDVAVAHLVACGAADECPMGADGDVEVIEGPWISTVDSVTGAVELVLQMPSRGALGQMYAMVVRAVVDESGEVVAWKCGDPGRPHYELEPCRG